MANQSWYLANLGIVRYVTRGSLAAGSSSVEDSPKIEEKPLSAPKPVKPVVIDLPASTPARKPATAEPRLVEEPEEHCHFRLACWQIPSQILVLDSLQPGKYPEPARVQMITRMLQALKKLPGELPSAEIIDWPPGPGILGNWSEAHQMMVTYLESRQTRAAYRWVLVMGEAAARAVQASKPYSDVLGQQLSLPGGAQAIVVRGMTEMLLQPETKKETWEAIRFLSEA